MGGVCGKSKKLKKAQSIMPDDNRMPDNMATGVSQQIENNKKTSNNMPQKNKKKVREVVKAVSTRNEEGYKMINDYIIDGTLGEGSFGKVKLGIKKNGEKEEKFALKVLKKSQLKRKREYFKDPKTGAMRVKDALEDVKREIAIMKKLSHKNLIQLHEVIDNPESDKIFMVLEYADHGQLIDWDEDEQRFIKKFDYQNSLLKSIFRDCIKSLNYLHMNGIIHRDIKPQNVLLSNETVKLSDFGVSTLLGENGDKMNNTQGTYHFMCPEACVSKSEGYSGKSADIWALGITFYAFIYLCLPFNGENVMEILENIQNQELVFPELEISQEIKDLIKKMLAKSEKERITLAELVQNPWLNSDRISLASEIEQDSLVTSISQEDIDNAYSLSTIIRIKNWVSKWRLRQSKEIGSEQKQ